MHHISFILLIWVPVVQSRCNQIINSDVIKSFHRRFSCCLIKTWELLKIGMGRTHNKEGESNKTKYVIASTRLIEYIYNESIFLEHLQWGRLVLLGLWIFFFSLSFPPSYTSHPTKTPTNSSFFCHNGMVGLTWFFYFSLL